MHQPEIKRFAVPALFVAIFLASAGLRIDNLSRVEVKQFPDTTSYTKKASWPLWSWEGRLGPLGGLRTWWLEGRSPTVPFFYKLAGNTPGSITIFQSGFSILCWSLLAWMVSRTMQLDWLKPIAFLIVLMFSLSDLVIMWDGFMLSDSISISLMTLFVTACFWLLKQWHWGKAFAMLAVGFLWAFSRDTNAWVIFMVASALIIGGALKRSLRYLVIAAIFVMVFFTNEISQNYSQRWVSPFLNVVGRRILPNPEWTAYFARQGMPVSPALTRLSGQLAWSQDRAFYKDPALGEFRDWVYRSGKSSYARFLLAHPVMTMLAPLRDVDVLIEPKLTYYRSAAFSPILDGALAEVIYFQKSAALWVLASGVIIGLGLSLAPKAGRRRWLVPLLMVMLAYPHAVMAWHGAIRMT